MNRRAVSEVIAFVLVFSIVITSVGLLYTVGFGSLGDLQSHEQDRSAERAFQAVAVGFDDIQRGRATIREVQLDLSGRSMHVDEDERLDVVVQGADDVPVNGTLVYGSGEDTEIAYQAGGVVWSQGEDEQLVSREPRFRCADDHAVVSAVEVQDDENTSFSSDGNVDIEAQRVDPDASRIVHHDDGADWVNVSYGGTRYEDAWNEHFEAASAWDNDASANEASCELGGGEVYVRKTVLEIDFVVA